MPVGRRDLAWFSPDPRAVLPAGGVHVSRSLRRVLGRFEVTTDRRFEDVVRACGDPSRPHGWIDERIVAAYTTLHRLGWAHSVEVWRDGALAGGLYGVAVGALFAAVAGRWGRLDLLVNNAGVFPPGLPLEDLAPADWRAALETNLTGAFLCTQAAFRMMKAQTPRGGRIINNGSISAQTPRPNAAAYTASKHAMAGLTKAAALEGRAFDIAVGQIDIGNAATEMTGPMAAGVLQANGTVAPEARTDAANAARLVAMMAALPLDANVLQATVIATAMPFVGRG